MSDARRDAIARKLAAFGRLCEVGIGGRHEVAATLASDGRSVTTTDVVAHDVPAALRFVRDDVVAAAARDDPGDAYRVDCVYALNAPPELHRPLVTVARRVDAACAFTTLGGDPPTVDVAPLALDGGDTLYVARDPRDALVE